MQAIKLKAHIDRNHRIEIQLPSDAPEGDAEVIILIPLPAPPMEKGLRALFDNLDRQTPRQGRSKEDIDAYLARERASWE